MRALVYYQPKRHVSIFVTYGTASLDFQFKCSSMKLLKHMKMKIKSVVETSYEFDTSRAPDSISRNTGRAQALLTNTTFIYRVRLIAPHLQPTEHRHMVHRISTLAGAHVIHIDTP
jgi:hypothetical protein